MSDTINIRNGEANIANVRSDIDLTKKKKPWEQGYAGGEEFAQKCAYQKSLGDSGNGISNRDVTPKGEG